MVFRASWAVRAAVLASLVAWLSVGALAATLDGVPFHAFAAIGFFVGFFVLCVSYYFNLAYVAHEYGITYRGATEFDHFDWDEIEHIEPSMILLGGYTVTTKRGVFVLNRWITGYDDLVEMIIARAGLFPVTR